MGTKRKVKLNPKSSLFFDPYTQVKVVGDDIVELNSNQLRSRKIKTALASGHLVYHTDSDNQSPTTEVNPKELDDKFKDLYSSGKSSAQLAASFTLNELRIIAKKHDIEPEDKDNKLTLISVILEDISE
jgi:hypothetical protein